MPHLCAAHPLPEHPSANGLLPISHPIAVRSQPRCLPPAFRKTADPVTSHLTTGRLPVIQIDLDTIETSNLNRQFLFRKHHVGQSKARTAVEVVAAFAPNAHLVAHHANVKEPRFDLDYFRWA